MRTYASVWTPLLPTIRTRTQNAYSDRPSPPLGAYVIYGWPLPVAAVPGRIQLRSAARGDLVIPATRTKTIGARGFSYACPWAWNALPMHLKDSSMTFTKQLKTFLFSKY